MEKIKFVEPEIIVIKVQDDEIIATSGFNTYGLDADAYGDIGALI